MDATDDAACITVSADGHSIAFHLPRVASMAEVCLELSNGTLRVQSECGYKCSMSLDESLDESKVDSIPPKYVLRRRMSHSVAYD
jgi:hypothetical protein